MLAEDDRGESGSGSSVSVPPRGDHAESGRPRPKGTRHALSSSRNTVTPPCIARVPVLTMLSAAACESAAAHASAPMTSCIR